MLLGKGSFLSAELSASFAFARPSLLDSDRVSLFVSFLPDAHWVGSLGQFGFDSHAVEVFDFFSFFYFIFYPFFLLDFLNDLSALNQQFLLLLRWLQLQQLLELHLLMEAVTWCVHYQHLLLEEEDRNGAEVAESIPEVLVIRSHKHFFFILFVNKVLYAVVRVHDAAGVRARHLVDQLGSSHRLPEVLVRLVLAAGHLKLSHDALGHNQKGLLLNDFLQI